MSTATGAAIARASRIAYLRYAATGPRKARGESGCTSGRGPASVGFCAAASAASCGLSRLSVTFPEVDRAGLEVPGAIPEWGTPAAWTGPSSPPGDSAATAVATAAAATTAAATRGYGRRSTLKRTGTLWPPEPL